MESDRGTPPHNNHSPEPFAEATPETTAGPAAASSAPAPELEQQRREQDARRKRHLARLADFYESAVEETVPADAAMQLSLHGLLEVEETIVHALRNEQLNNGVSLSQILEMQSVYEIYTKLIREKEKLAKFNARHEYNVPPLWTRRTPND